MVIEDIRTHEDADGGRELTSYGTSRRVAGEVLSWTHLDLQPKLLATPLG